MLVTLAVIYRRAVGPMVHIAYTLSSRWAAGPSLPLNEPEEPILSSGFVYLPMGTEVTWQNSTGEFLTMKMFVGIGELIDGAGLE